MARSSACSFYSRRFLNLLFSPLVKLTLNFFLISSYLMLAVGSGLFYSSFYSSCSNWTASLNTESSSSTSYSDSRFSMMDSAACSMTAFARPLTLTFLFSSEIIAASALSILASWGKFKSMSICIRHRCICSHTTGECLTSSSWYSSSSSTILVL